jgi:hypothetical protein
VCRNGDLLAEALAALVRLEATATAVRVQVVQQPAHTHATAQQKQCSEQVEGGVEVRE